MAAAETSNTVSKTAAKQFVAAFEDSELVELDLVRQWLSEIRYVDNPVPVLGTAEFLAQSQAYSLVAELADIKDSMSRFRKSMSAEATELRESLELLPSSQ